jgi:hypothetical protein
MGDPQAGGVTYLHAVKAGRARQGRAGQGKGNGTVKKIPAKDRILAGFVGFGWNCRLLLAKGRPKEAT